MNLIICIFLYILNSAFNNYQEQKNLVSWRRKAGYGASFLLGSISSDINQHKREKADPGETVKSSVCVGMGQRFFQALQRNLQEINTTKSVAFL